MSSVRRLGVIAGHELRIVRRDPLSFMVLIAFPIIIIAFLKPAFRPTLVQSGYVHANGAEQVVPGQAAMAAFFLVALVTFAFYSEHGWATWDRLPRQPATSLEIVLGKALPTAAMGFTQLVVLFGAGVLVFGLHIRGNPDGARAAVLRVLCVPRAARRVRDRAVPYRAAGQRVRVSRHGAVRCGRRRVRAVQPPARVGRAITPSRRPTG